MSEAGARPEGSGLAEALFSGPGELLACYRALDWSATPLGPVARWPAALRAVVRLCLDSAVATCVCAGPEHVLLYNDGFRQALGAARHPAALGRPAREAWPELWDLIGPELAQVTAGGPPVRREDRPFATARDGRTEEAFWTYALSPVRDDDGAVVAVHCAGAETTSSARAEAALRASEARYRALFESMDEAYAVVEVLRDDAGRWSDFRFLEVNPAFMTHTGMPYPVGRTATELLGAPNPRWAALYGQVAETGESTRVQEPELSLGRVFDLNIFRLGGPGSRRVAVLFTDVTARKHAEAALQASEARQAFLLALSDALRPLADPIASQEVAARLLGTHLGVDRCYYAEFDWPHDVLHIHHEYTRTGAASAIGSHPISLFNDLLVHSHRGEPLVCDDIETHPVYRGEKDAYRARGTDAFILIPLVKQGQMAACMCVTMETPRAWSPAEVELVQDVAERTWAAVERARAEAALRASEARYRTLFETMGQGYTEAELVRDADGRAVDYRLLEMNPAFERLLGIPTAGARGRLVTEVLPGLDPWWVETFDRVVRSGAPDRVEREVPQLGRWYEVHAHPAGGERFATFYENVTERKRAEAVLRAGEARQAFLLRLSDTLRPLTAAAAMHAETCRLLGEHLGTDRAFYCEFRTAEGVTVVGQDYVRGDVPSLRGTYAISDFAWMMALYARGRPVVVTDVWTAEVIPDAYRAASAAAHVAWIVVPLLREGAIAGTLCVADMRPRAWAASDVELVREVAERLWATMERARAEAARSASEARFRVVADLVPDLLWESEPDGSTAWYNARWLEYTGQTLEEARGWGWTAAIHADDRARSAANYARAAARGEPLVQEHRIRRHDGAYRWFLVRAEPSRDGGGIVRWFGAATDIHGQRTALEEVERLVGERTAERDTLRRQLAGAEEAERRRLARELHDQLGQELTAFRLGLADAARLAAARVAPEDPILARIAALEELAGRMTAGARYVALELRPPELDDLGLESAVTTYAREWSARYGVAAEVAVTGLAVERPVPADVASTLYRIVQEALTNVAKHAHATQVSVIVDKTDGELLLIVEDDGQGFDPERTAERTAEPPRGERRLGIVSMRERAALVGGTLQIESSPRGGGTTLYVRLSLDGPAGSAPDAAGSGGAG